MNTPSDTDRMYDVANDHEADVLDELRERAGITWTCRAGDSSWTNMGDERCEQCGRTKAQSRKAERRRHGYVVAA